LLTAYEQAVSKRLLIACEQAVSKRFTKFNIIEPQSFNFIQKSTRSTTKVLVFLF
jgi:hypothetical protein